MTESTSCGLWHALTARLHSLRDREPDAGSNLLVLPRRDLDDASDDWGEYGEDDWDDEWGDA